MDDDVTMDGFPAVRPRNNDLHFQAFSSTPVKMPCQQLGAQQRPKALQC
jgi:hypothetical protein